MLTQHSCRLWLVFHPVTMADEVVEREVVERTEVWALMQVSDTLLVSVVLLHDLK